MLATANAFFVACETGKPCAEYHTEDATFTAQSEPIADIKTLAKYTEWMKGFGDATVPGCSYELHHVGVDEERKSVSFFATFTGKHTGPGPCEPTNKTTNSHYVYVIKFNDANKIIGMTKIWNAPWAMKELGWM